MQTERGINLPLDEVYVSLTAERRVESQSNWSGLVEELLDIAAIDTFGKVPHKKESQRSVPVELEVAVSQNARLVFLGDPGAGKTTLMRFLALQFAKARQGGLVQVADKDQRSYGATKLPILVRVAEFADAFTKKRSLSVRDFLPRCLCGDLGMEEAEVKALYEEVFQKGEALVLLDGLDEVVSAADRAEIGRRIDSFVSGLPQGNRVIVTSRIMGYREAPLSAAFAEHTLRDMSVEQIEKFLGNWCPAYEKLRDPAASEASRKKTADAEAALLLKAVKDNPGVKRLATNPLLLTILALIHRNGSHLPKRRIELYRIASETLLRDWQLGRGTNERHVVEEYEALELLAPLAYWMHCHEPTGLIEKRDAERVLTRVVMKTRQLESKQKAAPVVAEFLRRVEQHTGIFVERAPGRYGFMHLTFEEYFAARYLVDDDETSVVIDRIQHLKHHPRWEEPIRLAVAFERPKRAARLVKEAILQPETPYEKWLCRDLLLAAQCLGDCHAVGELRPVIDEVGLKLLPHSWYVPGDKKPAYCDGLRNTVKTVLPKLESEAVISALVSLCQDKGIDVDVRHSAAEFLEKLGDASPSVVSALVSLCQDKGESVYVRLYTVQILGKLGDASPSVVSVLVSFCQDKGEDVRVRRYAAESLEKLGDERGISALVSFCQDKGEDVRVRRYAAESLEKLGDERGISTLASLCQDKGIDVNVRLDAAESLGKLGDERGISTLTSLCQDKGEDVRVRYSAGESLGKLGDERGISTLTSLCQDKGIDANARLYIVHILGKLGDASPSVVSALVSLCQDKGIDVNVRLYAVKILGKLGDASPSVVSALVSLCQNKGIDVNVRYSAAESLGKLGDASPSVVSALVSLCQDKSEDVYVRLYAAESLGKLGDEHGISALVSLCQDKGEDVFVHLHAGQSLGKLGGASPSVISALVFLCQNKGVNIYVRRSVARALGKLGKADQTIVKELYQDLENWVDDANGNWYGLSASAIVLKTQEVEAWALEQEM